MNVVCAWLRNDLRVHDNVVLHEAAKLSAQRKVPVLPVYVFDPRYFKRTRYKTLRTGCLRALFLLQSVLALKRTLKRKMGSDLLVKVGKPEEIFPQLLSSDSVLLTQQEVTSAELTIDSWVRFGLEKIGTSKGSPQLTYCWGSTLFHKDDIGFKDGFDDVPEFFSKFLHQLQEVWPAYSDEDWDDSSNDRNVGPDLSRISRLVRPARSDVKLGPVPEGLDFDFEPTWKDLPFAEKVIEPLPDKAMMGGEENGLKRLAEYVWHTNFASSYFPERQLIFGDYMASRLGPWLAVGALSPRKVFFECLRLCEEKGLAEAAEESRHARHLITELTWRDYFRFYAGKHGMDIYRQGGVKNYKRHWMQDERIFHLWSNGRTGYPLVDACMRELSITGYASNHARLNAASFLAYSMSFDWRRGADWFESHLIDYDVTSNWCNWVRCAGLTEGRLSSFNVVRQSQKLDPQGLYLRRWLPELQKVPMELIHEP